MKPEEKQIEIYRSALALRLRTSDYTKEDPELRITFDQALKILEIEQLWRLASIVHKLTTAIDDLNEAITEDISGSLDLTCTRLNDINQTLYDTLGSEKSGAALDALAEIPRIIKDK